MLRFSIVSRIESATAARSSRSARANLAAWFRVAEQLGDPGRLAETRYGPEVVPVGMPRLGEIAFVADGFRKQATVGRLLRIIELGSEATMAKRVEENRRAANRWPELLDETVLGREPAALRDRKDELRVAVVLRQPVGALGVHAAGHVAILSLVPRVPPNELTRRFVKAKPMESGCHDGSVADPGASVAARAGMQRRTIAVGEDVSRGGGDRFDERLSRGRKQQGWPRRRLRPL
ncbi:MAG: hypothetical protein U1E76_11900 [Planctomycetota bacterium]